MTSRDSKVFTKPSFWECDHCKRLLKHGEFRLNCTVCLDYDQCETCATSDVSSHPHRLVREIAYGYVEQVESSRQDLASRIRTAINTYEDRFCMGVRDGDSYSWETFKVIGERIMKLSHGLRRLMKPREFIGICGSNRPEWLITDFACILQSFITVPIYCQFTDREVSYIVQNTPLSIVVCDREMLPKFVRIHGECPSLRHIICMDPVDESMSKIDGLFIHRMTTIERFGSMKQYEFVMSEPDDCVTIIYTSGSSGFPKGAMISASAFQSNFPPLNLSFRDEHVKFCYRPLAWATDRQGSIAVFLSGGRIGFSTGNVDLLMEELLLVRPTSFSGPPTIWNKIYSEYKATLSLMTADQSDEDAAKTEEMLLKQFAKLIPNRCRVLSIGGAMVSGTVLDFMKRCFSGQCEIMESYGTTECGSISFDNVVEASVEYRLESVIEMGYTVEDKPFARGELLVKTNKMFSGYINNPEETKVAFTDDGYFRTGDIVEVHHVENGQAIIRIIDRKKNFFKLSQGQFVSPEFLENIYRQSAFVEQIYIHGNLLEDSVIAVIVPNREYAQAFMKKHHLNAELNSYREAEKLLCDAIMNDMRSLATKESLRKHEIPSRCIISFEPFTSENGLLTSSMKLCRYRLVAHFHDRLKATESIEDRLKSLVKKAIGRDFSSTSSTNIISLGNDSLAAVRLSRSIQNDLGVSIPLHLLFDSNMTLESLTQMIEDPSRLASRSNSIKSRLLQDAAEVLNVNIEETKDAKDSPAIVFITGTTGFVGGFLLAELLKVYPYNCKFICLVRCDMSTPPLDRIRKNMIFLQLWNETYEDRIVAVRGDLAQEYFGMEMETYSALANETDVIFHCGTVVNFVLPYEHLYSSNVFGTREVIRFASHHSMRCIPIHYISTMSVLPSTVEHEVHIDEVSTGHLRTGYAQSKWVAEKLIAEAVRLGLSVTIYRLGSIWADSETGACNQHDIFTLFIRAMMKTGCFPTTATNTRLNGLPVNLAVQGIVSLSRQWSNINGKVHHIVPFGEGISFENLIVCMRQCGMTLNDVSYEEWKRRVAEQSESVVEFFSENPFERTVPIRDSSTSTIGCEVLDDIFVMKWLKFILNHIIGDPAV
ncbi:unnamed protein product [Adineta ricciae]|uniref:long-chain-fatty-acid--CoA ligase n=1 Tax=Adineta ricciae TaxID=249248 RepID=A0A815TYU2_ADIRI|nr:unnamed protein product [Adineta ricciae]